MSTSITIRDVPDDIRDELTARARLSGRSVQEYLLAELIELTRRPDSAVLLTRIRDRKHRPASRSPADRIITHRDVDRR